MSLLRLNAVVPFLLLLIMVSVAATHAQTGDLGSIEGIATDPSGAVVAGVTVKARNVQTSATFRATTNEDGLFQFPVLPLGTYRLTTECAGFATLILKDVDVTVGARINVSLALQLAEKSESVVVRTGTPLVETTRSQVSTTVENRLITDLPINGRAVIEFALLTAGVTRDVRGGLSFAGQRESNALLVDGADNNGHYFGEPLGADGFFPGGTGAYQFSQEAVQEIQVNSNSYSAEFGRASGGVLNLVTKSGTNQFRCAAFEFFRDKSMNANDAVNKLNRQPKSPFHFHQFGGALGGPVVKDKLFFFVNYEGQRSSVPNTVILNLPDGFHLSSDPTIAGFQQRALDYVAPRAFSWVRSLDQNVYLTKLDWRIAPAQQLTGRWSRQRFTAPTIQSGGAQNSFENGGTGQLNADSLAFALTSTLSPSLANVARFSYVRTDSPFLTDSINPQANIFEGGQLVLTIGRTAANPQDIAERYGQWSDTLSYFRGRHSVKVGADILLDRVTFFNTQNFSGNYRFASLESFGRSLAGAPAPQPGDRYVQAFSGAETPGVTVHPNSISFAGFVQDEWRLRPSLTLNLGLRYDLQTVAQPPVKNPSLALAAVGLDTSFLRTDKNNIAPRLGFAWTSPKNNRLVVRGGYGIFYVPTLALSVSRADFQNGITVQTRIFSGGNPGAALIPAYPNTICGPPDPSGAPPSCAAPATGAGNPILFLFASDYTHAYTHQGSFGVEVQLQKNLAVSVSYLGVNGTHLQRTRDVNLATPTAAAKIGIADTSIALTFQKFTVPRPISGFDRILVFESDAHSIYHGLAVQVNKRFSQNFQFLASYTFSKVIDDAPTPYAVNVPGADPIMLSDPSNPRADRSVGANDQRHRFVLSGVWELNYASHLPQVASVILEGWQLSAILTAQSGQPYSGLVSFDLNNDGNSSSDRTPGLGRNIFYLPATVSFDPRATRTVQLTERVRLQFIWEAFNVFNRTNITGVQNTQYAWSPSAADCGIASTPCLVPQTTGLSAFGTPTATSGPRIMQLSAKFVF
jgi:outer membrane receptor protein involved in Fe transport